jgi:phosphatidylinositol phospholipase C, delta
MLLNYGRFEDNGSCGYVLKPEFMRDPNSTFDPDGSFPAEQSRTLKVRVISGYLLPKKAADRTSNILDPLVKVGSFYHN